jgi:hypothetical protein
MLANLNGVLQAGWEMTLDSDPGYRSDNNATAARNGDGQEAPRALT